MKKKAAPKPYDFARDGVTQSILGVWFECCLKARHKLQGWRILRTKSNLVYGTVGHEIIQDAVELWLGEQSVPGKDYDSDVLVGEACERYRKQQDSGSWFDKQHEEFDLIQVQLEAVMAGYFSYWGEDDLTGKDWVGVEHEFAVPHCGTILRGKMDGLFKQGKSPVVWLFESKFKGRIDEEAIADALERDFQSFMYMLAVKLLRSNGKRPRGVLYNIIRKPQSKLKKNESFRSYRDRLAEDVEKRPEHYFKRMKLKIDESEFASFEAELAEMLEVFGQWVADGMPGWKFGQPCFSRYGLCEFLPFCFRESRAGYHQAPLMPELSGIPPQERGSLAW